VIKISFEEYQQSASYSEFCGHNIAHWESGTGSSSRQCILLIHGFPSAAWDWHYQWMDLAKSYHVITLDMLGFGLSDKPKSHQYSLLEQADIISAVLEKKGISRCHILAHDYGDSVAQELLSRHESKELGFAISSLCYLNGGLFVDSHRPLLSQLLLKGPLGPVLCRFMGKGSLKKSLRSIFGDHTPPAEEDLHILWRLLCVNEGQRVLPAVLKYLDERAVHGERWVKSMQSTELSQYFINGVQDPISGQHMLDRYQELIPHSHTTAVNVGHYPQLEAPEQVLQLYKIFLQEQQATSLP
jgi:pimeloyl-ACP methyl ester carboxylesterase